MSMLMVRSVVGLVLTALRRRFPFRKWQFSAGMFCGSKYAQNTTKDFMISQTEFAAKKFFFTKNPMSARRKKMREHFADKADIHAFREVSGSISWFAGQTRPYHV